MVAACYSQPAGCGMLVAGGFCYRMLLDESCIARESQNSPAPARASDRLLSISIHEKHRIVRFFLGKRSLLVLRFASCEAVVEGEKAIATSPSAVGTADEVLLSSPGGALPLQPLGGSVHRGPDPLFEAGPDPPQPNSPRLPDRREPPPCRVEVDHQRGAAKGVAKHKRDIP